MEKTVGEVRQAHLPSLSNRPSTGSGNGSVGENENYCGEIKMHKIYCIGTYNSGETRLTLSVTLVKCLWGAEANTINRVRQDKTHLSMQ